MKIKGKSSVEPGRSSMWPGDQGWYHQQKDNWHSVHPDVVSIISMIFLTLMHSLSDEETSDEPRLWAIIWNKMPILRPLKDTQNRERL